MLSEMKTLKEKQPEIEARIAMMESSLRAFETPLFDSSECQKGWGATVETDWSCTATGLSRPTDTRQQEVRQAVNGHYQTNPTDAMQVGMPYPLIGGVPKEVVSEVLQCMEVKNDRATDAPLIRNQGVQEKIYTVCSADAGKAMSTETKLRCASLAADSFLAFVDECNQASVGAIPVHP